MKTSESTQNACALAVFLVFGMLAWGVFMLPFYLLREPIHKSLHKLLDSTTGSRIEQCFRK